MPENGKPVWILIKGVQHLDGESDTVELNTTGVMERTDRGFRLTYDESVSIGIEGVTTCLSVQPDLVTLERQGAMNSLLVLQKGKRTLCNYDTGYGCLTMGSTPAPSTSAWPTRAGHSIFTTPLISTRGLLPPTTSTSRCGKRLPNEEGNWNAAADKPPGKGKRRACGTGAPIEKGGFPCQKS